MAQTTRLGTRKCLFGMPMMKNTSRGCKTPKTIAFFDPVGKSQPKLWRSITFKRYDSATYLYYITHRKSMLPFLNLQKYSAHKAPCRRYLDYFTDVRCMLVTTVYWKPGPETAWKGNYVSQESTPSPAFILFVYLNAQKSFTLIRLI